MPRSSSDPGRNHGKRWVRLLAGVAMLTVDSGCVTSPRDLMTSWVTSLEWFDPEYAGSAERYEQLEQAWQQEQLAGKQEDAATRWR